MVRTRRPEREALFPSSHQATSTGTASPGRLSRRVGSDGDYGRWFCASCVVS